MMRLPRIIPALPIIALVLLPCIYCAYFQVKQHMIRMEMQEKIESEQVQTVIVPVKDFRWYEEDREIIVDGMMFDVKSIRRENDNYIITGLYDEDETELHIAMGKLQKNNNHGPDAELISVILSQTLIAPVAEDIFKLPSFDEAACRIISPDEQLFNTILSIYTPPPRA